MRKIIQELIAKDLEKINHTYKKKLSLFQKEEIIQRVFSNLKSNNDLKDLEDLIKEILEEY